MFETLLYILWSRTVGSGDFIMDKFFSIFTFPIGLLICFSPALYVWLKAELKSPPPSQDKDRKP